MGSEASAPARGPLAGLIARVRAFRADASHNSIAQRVAGAAFLIRLVSAVLIFGTQILFARWMGSFEFGIYIYVWTLVMLIGDLADLGLASSAQRFIPAYAKRKSFDLLRGFLARSRWLAVGSATTVAIVGALTIQLIEQWLPHYLVLPLSIACVTLPFYGLVQMQDGIARSYNWVHLSLVPPYIARHLLMLVLVSAAYVFNFPTTATVAVGAVAASFAITAIVQAVVLNRKLRRTVEAGPKAYEVKVWFGVSLPILMMEAFYLLLTNTDILMLQHLGSPNEVGIYYAAAKTLTLVAFVHFAVSAAVAHRFTEYHVTGDRQRLAQFLAASIRWTFWPSAAATAAILLMGKPLLALFGPSFVEGYDAMFILAVGLLARSAIGPVQRLLTMLGEQRICAAVYGFAFFINLVLCVILIPHYGIKGAATSTAIALVVESVLLFWVTKTRLKLHVFIWGRPTAQ